MSTMPAPQHAEDNGVSSRDWRCSPKEPDLLFQDAKSVNTALEESLTHWDKIGVRGRWIVNSHPKSGTHLLKNILLHFSSAAVHQEMLFYDTFAPAFIGENNSQIYTAHLPYSMCSTAMGDAGNVQSILLLRHPCAIALALARAFYDVNTTRPDHLFLRERDSFEEIVRKVVCGYECAGLEFGPLAASLSEFCLEWQGKVRFTVKFEDIVAKLRGADDELLAYFQPILEAIFEAIPADAALRIRAGSSTAISATFSRTRESACDMWTADDIYTAVPAAASAELRDISRLLGY